MASIVSTRSSSQKRDNQAENYSIANTAQQELGTNAKHNKPTANQVAQYGKEAAGSN